VKKGWLLPVSLALVLTIVGLAGCGTNTGSLEGLPSDLRVSLNSQQEGIWVSGRGVVTVTPDIAVLRLGVEVQSASVATAQSQAAEAMGKIMTALTDNGIAEKDIQTQHYSIYPITKWDQDDEEQIVTGYRVTHTVNAKIRNIDEAGTIIDTVTAAGGDYTRINSISFSVDEPSTYYEEARGKAMADAKAKATQLAELADAKLGKATYISESSYIPAPTYRQDVYEEAMSVGETSISPGELEISLTIQVNYALSY